MSRKSVIVKRPDLEYTQSAAEELTDDPAINNLILTLDINELEFMYTKEEDAYVGQLCTNFKNHWSSINYGEEIMSSYVALCIKRQMLPARYMKLVENSKK